MRETVVSNKGFYVGDICYVLNDDLYHGVWGAAGYENGVFTDTASGLKFAVAGTLYGDGEYQDQQGRRYGVDAGVIGIVPIELVAPKYYRGGHIFECAGEAMFEAEDGVFNIILPDGQGIFIDTGDAYDDEY